MKPLALCLCLFALPVSSHAESRIAVMSAFQPEWQLLKSQVTNMESTAINGTEFITGTLAGKPVVMFLSGISMVNAAMTTQLALDRFDIDTIVFSGIAGGVDPSLSVGDVVVAAQWGQYLDSIFGRARGEDFVIPPWMDTEFPGFGMMYARNQQVASSRQAEPETRFWFPVDAALLSVAQELPGTVELAKCDPAGTCLSRSPQMVIGGNGVSGAAFVDNAAFRAYAFETFGARVLDMESAAVAHVAYANQVPFIAFRSLSDLAGGGEQANELPTFFGLAAQNAATVVTEFLARLE
ncbi:5'-methylthioadenosine/S-adenosylhomocysteine nucleosidase [Meridianimarinicoccus aquatilis]|uniref:Phosphorylase n=1 Tax=Meridianimarinicoccus aquatilis TaxID=2552766 RepID=A0A4R6AR88_9RHOB|nr:5'-methylthioadenosine/S-adenosylhomocysteine nucleosidase [Fluviibacterium aquatile]TDL86062.1 phosphorylase [Fluviibacterium aquatile]